MAAKLSPAQRANQITFFLKGDLKNIQIAYLRAGAKLAKIRDEKLYLALEHETLEDYAAKRLGMARTSLYRYLRVHDWALVAHPGWLARHPKGFIPELTDAQDLMHIETRLADEHLGPETRKELEALRRKALRGELAQSELERFRRRGEKRRDSLTAVAASCRALRRRLASLGDAPPALLEELDRFLEHLKSASGAVASAVVLGSARGTRLAGLASRSPSAGTLRA